MRPELEDTKQTVIVCFNSRTREGCDLQHLHIYTDGKGFNSRTREGCDILPTYRTLHHGQFQFTHPGGVRRGATPKLLHDYYSFNSRTREGCDKNTFLVSL